MLLYFLNCQGYAQADSCVITAEIRNKIENYINYNDCYFSGNGKDVKLYLYLGDSILLKNIKTDDKAMKLLVELYLINP